MPGLRMSLATVLIASLAAACVQREPAPPTGTSAPPDDASFASGIYYARPLANGSSELVFLNGSLPTAVYFGGIGFDVQEKSFISVDGTDFEKVSPTGKHRRVAVSGLHHLARPSLAPDNQRFVVQAVDHPDLSGGAGDNFDTYLVNVQSGTSRRLSNLTVNDESPEWFPRSDRVVWSSFDPQAGLDAHVYDLGLSRVVLTIPDAGAVHLAVSPDERRLLDPGRLRIYDLEDGSLVADLREEVLASLRALGYAPDARFPGQANRGTFPLDGSFSPDGTRIVFDGAVERNGQYGVIVATVRTDGTGLGVLVDLTAVDPARSNNHNFSQLNPTWI